MHTDSCLLASTSPAHRTEASFAVKWRQELAAAVEYIHSTLIRLWPALASLQLRLSLAIGLTALLVLAAVGGYAGGVATDSAVQFQGERFKADTRTVAVLLARQLEERETEIDLLRRSGAFVRGDLSGADVQNALERLKSKRKELAWIGVSDAQGKIIAATGGLLTGVQAAQRPWFIHGMRGVYTGDVHEAVLLAKKLPHKTLSGEPLRFVDFAAPILDERGQVRGVLAAHAHWQWVSDVVTSGIDPVLAERSTETLVIDRYGNVLHPFEAAGSTPLPQSLSQDQTGASIEWPDGRRYVTASTQVMAQTSQDLGWRIVMRQPETLALEPVSEMRNKLRVMGVIATLLITLIAWRLSRQLSQPIEAVASAAQQLKRGHGSPVYPRRPGSQELSQMIDAVKSIGEMAQKDALTGAFNRRHASALMQQMFERRRNHGTGYGLIMIDADHFKKINDTHGHQTGDAVLIDLCRIA